MTVEGDPDHQYYESLDLRSGPPTNHSGLWSERLAVDVLTAPVRLRANASLATNNPNTFREYLVSDFSGIAGGKGGYWEDLGYTWYGGI